MVTAYAYVMGGRRDLALAHLTRLGICIEAFREWCWMTGRDEGVL